MAAPIVTRPNTANVGPKDVSPFPMNQAVHWAKWIVLAFVVILVGSLAALGIVSMNERKRTEEKQRNWDEVFNAMKSVKDEGRPEDRARIQDQIAALEKVTDKVAGSTAHAYVLMKLGNLYSDMAFKYDNQDALKKSIALYELVATKEPYKDNPAFGPLAIENLALAREHARDYNGAIEVLSTALSSGKLDSHILYHELMGHLGRIYWLRSQQETEQAASAKDDEKKKLLDAAEADRKLARTNVSEALRASATEGQSEWRSEAEYIRSLVPEKFGPALPDGKAPPEKPAAAIVPPPGAPNGAPKINMPPGMRLPPGHPPVNQAVPPVVVPPAHAAPPVAIPPTPEKKADDSKKDDAKKDDAKKDDAKKKEQGNLGGEDENAAQAADLAPGPDGHLTYAQMQQMLKSGKPVFCQCPRCRSAQKSPAAKLVE